MVYTLMTPCMTPRYSSHLCPSSLCKYWTGSLCKYWTGSLCKYWTGSLCKYWTGSNQYSALLGLKPDH